MSSSAPRPAIGTPLDKELVTAAAAAWDSATRHATRTACAVVDYLRWRWHAVLDELRPYERDSVQKRRLHREAWQSELEGLELDVRAVPMTARAAAQEAQNWDVRIAAVEARYAAMRQECLELCHFSLLQIPFDRSGFPREWERFGSARIARVPPAAAGAREKTEVSLRPGRAVRKSRTGRWSDRLIRKRSRRPLRGALRRPESANVPSSARRQRRSRQNSPA
jgi:hypothetical protein